MNQPFFSIVISAYNKEKYVKKCILSVLEQSFCDFELIIIDDFSIDSTANIIKEFSDKRIKYYKLPKNKGVSHCRNYGLDCAAGSYILFVDADDWLLPDVLKNTFNKLKNTPSDMLFVPYGVYNEDKNEYKYKNKKYKLTKLRKLKTPISQKDLKKVLKYLNFEVWNKFFNVQMLKDNNIKFKKDLSFSEDFVFFCDVILRAKTFSYIKQTGYIYNRKNKKYDTDIIVQNFNRAILYLKESIKDTIFEDIIMKKCAHMLNFWIVKCNFSKEIYTLACDFCKNQRIININSLPERLIYKFCFKIGK